MTLSRMVLLAAAFQPSSPQTPRLVTAEEALEIHRGTFDGTVSANGCPSGEGEEIVVCGRREPSPYRYTGPVAREPGAHDTLPGEMGRASTNVGGCIRLCPQPVTVDLIGAGRAIAKGIGQLLDPDR